MQECWANHSLIYRGLANDWYEYGGRGRLFCAAQATYEKMRSIK